MNIENLNTNKMQVVNELDVISKGVGAPDLLELQPYPQKNYGYRYILVVINCYSKYLFTEAVENKTGKEVTRAFRNILRKSGYSPLNLQTDNGIEFYYH